jgi:tetratricopeptide (TPR) repeat protein
LAYHIRPPAAHFVNREEELRRAMAAVAGWRDKARPLTITVSGLSGVGKTELAFMIARLTRERHAPQDVLYIDLDPLRRDGGVEVGDALGDLLLDLKVEPEALGRSLPARQKQYWERTDRSRLVLIVDNARYGAELVPLLPASGDSVVIVASQSPLHDLEEGASVPVALHPLADPYAAELLRRMVDDPRLTADPEAVEGFLRLCSGLPEALRVAARRIRKHRRRQLSRLLADLTADLDEEGLPMVEKVWDAAYQELGADGALLYRLLAHCPGGACSAEAAVALLGGDRDAAEAALEDLEAAGLLESGDARVRLHDLLRAHARRKARRDGSEAERVAGLCRVVRWYLRQAQRADAVAAGSRLTLAGLAEPVPGAPDVPFGDGTGEESTRHAYQWLATERHVLHACVRLAHDLALDFEAWALCEPLWTHFLDVPQHAAALEAFGTGVAAAQRAGDVRALVRMRCQLARPLWELTRYEEAGEELRLAFGAASALGDSERDRKLGASVLEFRGMLAGARGDWEAAAGDFERARRVHQEIQNAYGAMLQTYRLGEALARLGELDRAADLLTQAHEASRELGRLRMTARTGFALAGVLSSLGRRAEAGHLYAAALASARDRHSSHDEARVLTALADLAEETGDAASAREHREAARTARERSEGLG